MPAAMPDGPLCTLLHRVEDRCARAVDVLRTLTSGNGGEELGPVSEAALERVTEDLDALASASLAARHDPAALETTVTDLRRRLGEEGRVMPATVTPIRPGVTIVEPVVPEPVIPRRPAPMPCAICGLAAYPHSEDRTCTLCGAALHQPCYWGRVATLSEWQAYFAMLDGDDENPPWPPTVCGACRAKAGA